MEIKKLVNFYSAFSDETRLKILLYLQNNEQNVTSIATELDLTISNTSHQLKYLKQMKLVKARKVGKYAFYSLDDEHVNAIIKYGIDHVNESE